MWYYWNKEGGKMIKIAVVDDDQLFVTEYKKNLKKLFNNHEVECEIDTYTEAYYFQGVQNDKNYNLIFLDIDMPEITGIDLADEIRKMNSRVTLVFVSNHDHFVFETFRYAAYRFIRKEKLKSDTEEMVASYCQEQKVKSSKMKFDLESKRKVTENLYNIWYFYASRHDIFYVKENKDASRLNTHKYTLDSLENDLTQYGYVRIHRSYLVNCEYIYELKNDSVVLIDGQELTMSRGRIDEVKKAYQKLVRERGKL